VSLLEVDNLRVAFDTEDGRVQAVDGISFSVEKGKTLGIVGESGCGKSVASLTMLGLTRSMNSRIEGRVEFEGRDLLSIPETDLEAIRGNEVSMIFQDPLSSLHPFFKIGHQLSEAVLTHRDVSKGEAAKRAVEMLDLVGIPNAEARSHSYPHEFSGGMRQRVMIAMALINDPKLLIADEPTTALDVTTQAQILGLIDDLQEELGMSMILITHDLGVVAQNADEIAVMYAGQIVERSPVEELFFSPQHPYTWGLLGAIPRIDRSSEEPLIPVTGQPPSLIHPPGGCRFHPRCPYVQEACSTEQPSLETTGGGGTHHSACLLSETERKALWASLEKSPDPASAIAAAELKVVQR
jgi:peptide/nickel transport system ATP-binding protein